MKFTCYQYSESHKEFIDVSIDKEQAQYEKLTVSRFEFEKIYGVFLYDE